MTITSSHNEKLKEIRKLARRRTRDERGRFVAEGEDLVAAAAAAGWSPVHLLAAAGSGLDGDEVEDALLAGVSSLGSGTRQLGVYEERWSAPAGPLCVALWGVGDPGNVGTILRSARAFGAASVALGPGCADPFGPKAVRASMGAIFELPVARVAEVGELPGERVALVAHEGAPLAGPAAGEISLLVGAERAGLPDGVVRACDRIAHIPIAGESLNAAMAATVALYELRESRP
ncbi:MAG: methyltransferase, TrmH family [Solirubrobacteraceae bacterium]|jgi:TrmH family RNA methyltransferase|nr:methyltransferase, TrmH family [Solirubrobacteraceae bacterium]